ncbi:MAG: COG4315 family predicted lipoprotein [Acidimicrobiales bacterium]
MPQPPSRWKVAAVAAMASFALAAVPALGPPAGASTGDSSAKPHATVVKVKSSARYGRIVVSSSGRTLYLLTSETMKSLRCTGGCLALWPPLLTTGKPRAGTGIDARKLGTVRRGSSSQVTYYGHPLYFYAGDKAAGTVNGEGIGASGGTWYVLTETGSPVKAARASSSGGSGGGW